MKKVIKSLLSSCGFTVQKRDRLEEQIPSNYLKSPFLPRLYKQTLGRAFYFREMFETVRELEGDIVECGVSVGYGILIWSLLCELSDEQRQIYGYDSFSGFPASGEADRKKDNSFQTEEHGYASPPELVLKVLADGRASADFVDSHIRLVRGYFEETVAKHNGDIALLHLDCDLHDSYVTCLTSLYSKVVSGGVILFDEYHDSNFPGAKQAIDAFFADKPEKPLRYDKYGYVRYYTIKQ